MFAPKPPPVNRRCFMSTKMIFLGLCVFVSLVAFTTGLTTGEAAESFSDYVSTDGVIRLPQEYRQNWEHLGDWAVGKREGEPLHEIHSVYSPTATAQAYRDTGEWPDGAVLVKEVHEVTSDNLTTGHVTWAAEMKIWFMMVRDRENRFPDNANWGDGWGWALFDAGDRSKNISTNYARDCRTCHVPVQQTDWIFIQGYRTLHQTQDAVTI